MKTENPHPPGTRPQMIRTGRYMWILPVLAVVVITALAVRWLSERPRELHLTQGQQTGTLRDEATPELESDAVPSTGGDTATAAATSGSLASPAIVKEIETITGSLDGHELIGRRVDLRVPVHAAGAGDTTFWIGSGDNRLLVVLERDTRQDQSEGAETVEHRIRPVNGRAAFITGTIQRVPDAEERVSWRLTRQEEEELLERNIYVRAERVVPDGHGE